MIIPPRFDRFDLVPVTEIWPHEARHFTPWLSKNLDQLSLAIGIPLELQDTEVRVDRYAADILARNSLDGSRVLIENQLDTSDHTHLGQILTYVAGLKPTAIVWIAPIFTDPHLEAIRWLNQHTNESISFFGVLVSAIRFENSPIVTRFDVVVSPDNPFGHAENSASMPFDADDLRRTFGLA